MARRPVFEACMLCGELPCSCFKAAKKSASKVRKAIKPEPEVTVETEIKCGWCTAAERAAGMPCACNIPTQPAPVDNDPPIPRATAKEALRAAMRAQVKASPTPTRTAQQPTGSDPAIDDAIRALEPILHPDEKRNRRHILSQPRTIEVRAAAWRDRNRGTV